MEELKKPSHVKSALVPGPYQGSSAWSSHSPLPPSSAKLENTANSFSESQRSPCVLGFRTQERPPISVVLVREKPWTSPDMHLAKFPSTEDTEYDPLSVQSVVSVRSSTAMSPRTTSFRLQPRTRPGAPSIGRKRNAQCLSSFSSSASAAEQSGDSDAMAYPVSVGKGEECPKSAFSSSPSTLPVHGAPSLCFESEMESLSIRSPRAHLSPMHLAGSNASTMLARSRVTPARSTIESSFTLYSSPTGGAAPCPRLRSNSIGSQSSSVLQSSSLASSAKSSPRMAPLMVLTRVGSSVDGDTPQKRPPLHTRPSVMLLSLDAAHSNMNGKEDSAMPSTPQKFAGPSTCTPEAVSTPDRYSKNTFSPARSFDCETPQTVEDHTVLSAHSTPLPRIKLTPRATPEKARDYGLLSTDFVYPRSGSTEETPGLSRPTSYLPIPDWGRDVPEARRRLSPTTSLGAFDWFPSVKGTSVFDSSDANMDFIQDMAREQARAAAMDADGSLSDPDEEEPFVLTDPATLAQAQERFPSGPARQRQRLSYSSLEQNTLLHPWTGNSLTQAHASNTSLLGIDFVRIDSAISLSKQALTGSGSRAFADRLCATAESDGLGQRHRAPSHESLQSIGLALEATTDSTRDLVTPPPLPHDAGAMTLSAPKLVQRYDSVRISGSSAAAIDHTIAMMAFHTRNSYDNNMSPGTMSHGNMSPGTMCLG